MIFDNLTIIGILISIAILVYLAMACRHNRCRVGHYDKEMPWGESHSS